MNATQDMFERRPKNMQTANVLYFMPEKMPHITVEEREVEVYVVKLPSDDDSHNTCEVHYFLHEHQASRKFRAYQTYEVATIDEMPPSEQMMQRHGIQRQTITAPVYTVHIPQYEKAEEDFTLTREGLYFLSKDFLKPEDADDFFQGVVTEFTKVERRFTYTMGYDTPQGFLEQSAAAPLMQHYGFHVFQEYNRTLQKLRNDVRDELEITVHPYMRKLIFEFEVSQEVHRTLLMKLFRHLAEHLYGWFTVEEYGSYPFEWLMSAFVDEEHVRETIHTELAQWWKKATVATERWGVEGLERVEF